MKPIVIIKEKNKNGNFELTEKELRELIEQAYKQGFEDGKAQYQPDINSWHIRGISDKPSIPTYPHDIYGNPIPYCSGGTASGPRDNQAILNTKLNDLVYRG